MLNIFADMMNVASRQERWAAPAHWREQAAQDRRLHEAARRDHDAARATRPEADML
jgi:hypothetical protein